MCAFSEDLYFFKIRRCSKSNKVKACTQTAAEVGNFRETEIPADFLYFSPFVLFFQRTGQLQCQVEEAREAQLQAQEEAARLAEVRMCPHTTADATYEVACVTYAKREQK